jgi:hypothetical protein
MGSTTDATSGIGTLVFGGIFCCSILSFQRSVLWGKIEDTKEEIRSRNSQKDSRHNGQMDK